MLSGGARGRCERFCRALGLALKALKAQDVQLRRHLDERRLPGLSGARSKLVRRQVLTV